MPEPGSAPVALVTGASRGLGLLLAAELARRGHDLVVCARSADGLQTAAERLRTGGRRVLAVPADVGVRTDVERLVAAAVSEYGRLDVLVNNAGIIQVGPLTALTVEHFEQALDVMVLGPVYSTLAALPHLRRSPRGVVLNITSIGGKVPAPHLLPYATAKFAAVGFSETLRAELAGSGVSVTTAVPGLMRTGSPRNALFTGDATAEYRWFALADSLPLLSIDAERAARRIVCAALRGRPEVILTPTAHIAVRLHGLAPGLTTRAAGLAARLLPGGGPDPLRPGHATGRQPGWFRAATALTRRAARRYGEHADETRVAPQEEPEA